MRARLIRQGPARTTRARRTLLERIRKNAPSKLRELPVWLQWKEVEDKKIPLYADGSLPSGELVSPENRVKLLTFEQVAEAFLDQRECIGLGVALGELSQHGLRISGIDLDDVFLGSRLDERAQQLVKAANSYAERSPSGNGLHILGVGNIGTAKVGGDGPGLEIYSASRYFTVTGIALNKKGLSDLTAAAALARKLFHVRVHHGANAITAREKSLGDRDTSVPRSLVVPEGMRNDTVFREACRLRGVNTPEDEAQVRLHAFNAQFCRPPLKASEVDRCLKSAWQYAPGYPTNDLGNAQRFVDIHRANVRYVVESREFIYWDQHQWRIDIDNLAVQRLMKASNRRLFDEARDCQEPDRSDRLARFAVTAQNTFRVRQAVESVKSEAGVAIRASELNADQLLLGVANGVIDLRDGTFRLGRRKDLITARAGCEYEAEALCPIWCSFLSRALNNDAELIDYVQRLVGYTLTGQTIEQILLFAHGPGANGKTVFFETLRALLADYAKTMRTEALAARMSGSRGGASEDEARLVGARFVQANETSQGMRFNDAAIKDLTGGDTIAARRLYENSFEFRPQFKLWIRGNYKPVLNGGDGGIARRVKLIPFAVHIPPAARDPNLLDKLKGELSGILNWAIQGCLKWRQNGLREPRVVQRATAEYLAEMDPIGSFLEDCCVVEGCATDSIENLHRAYSNWCTTNGRPTPAKSAFSRQLSERGFTRFRSRMLGRPARRLRGVRVSSKPVL